MISFDDLKQPEPSSLIGFSQNTLVRDAEHRDETSLPEALQSPDVQFHAYSKGRVLVLKEEDKKVAFELAEIAKFEPDMSSAILLGHSNGKPLVAIRAQFDPETLEEPYAAYDMRSLLYASNLDPHLVSSIGHGSSLMHWHKMNQFCGKCGQKSEMKIGGYRRDCPGCESTIFPRTDPVVIMLPVMGDRCVMGRSPHFPEGWYSTLAGFLEPGETIEQAVRRETFEESGIEIDRVKYYASQPWPFPHSLMIGIHCEATSDKINMDESELEDCRWFDRDEVLTMIDDNHPDGLKCPPNLAISSSIILAWVNKK